MQEEVTVDTEQQNVVCCQNPHLRFAFAYTVHISCVPLRQNINYKQYSNNAFLDLLWWSHTEILFSVEFLIHFLKMLWSFGFNYQKLPTLTFKMNHEFNYQREYFTWFYTIIKFLVSVVVWTIIFQLQWKEIIFFVFKFEFKNGFMLSPNRKNPKFGSICWFAIFYFLLPK